MLEELLIGINDLILEGFWLSLLGCYAWGIASTILSPCHLASIPILVSYVAGQTLGSKPHREALGYALFFSFGLFLAVFCTGVACACLGRMLGDIPKWMYLFIGFLLVVIGLYNALKSKRCAIYWDWLFRWKLEGWGGALVLGFLYGLLAGVCTFGFLAPMLGVIFVNGELARGVLMSVVFGIGHCTPIVLAGISVSIAETKGYQKFGWTVRRWSSLLIVIFGLFFIYFGC
ncbi:MAG: sulfite exporter TauE/SafE family protein [Desulfovibrionaceae bacterium]|nr:sulfite exporter TauE/SafE family protein [Desulfovibrionaceae bacterium]